MNIWNIILMAFAVVFLVIAAFWAPPPGKPQFGWLGLAFWALAVILSGLMK